MAGNNEVSARILDALIAASCRPTQSYPQKAGSSPRAQYHPCVDHSTHGVICGNPACRTILSPAMIVYALGARTVRGNSTSSRTPPLGAALPRHTGLRTRHQRARQRIPGILHPAQRKCWRSAAGDPQTLAAPVANIAGNAFCTGSKKCEVSTNDTYAEGARDSRHPYRWLESVWITICPAAYLEPAKKGIDISLNRPVS